jgi:hypothetical protein
VEISPDENRDLQHGRRDLRVWTTLAVLQHCHPLARPLEVQIKELPEAEGSTEYREDTDSFVITISNALDEKAFDEVLVHEYAHALIHEYSGPSEDAVWGVVYASLYNLIFGDH